MQPSKFKNDTICIATVSLGRSVPIYISSTCKTSDLPMTYSETPALFLHFDAGSQRRVITRFCYICVSPFSVSIALHGRGIAGAVAGAKSK
jgi:hypothetical protein